MSQTFGRRAPAPHAAYRPSPPVLAALPEDAPKKVARKAAVDPELEAWKQARAKTRWGIWASSALLVLGGPMSFLLPEGIGQVAGIGLMVMGAAGFLARLRKNRAPET